MCMETLYVHFFVEGGIGKKTVAEFTAEVLTCYFLHRLRVDVFQFLHHLCVNCFLSTL